MCVCACACMFACVNCRHFPVQPKPLLPFLQIAKVLQFSLGLFRNSYFSQDGHGGADPALRPVHPAAHLGLPNRRGKFGGCPECVSRNVGALGFEGSSLWGGCPPSQLNRFRRPQHASPRTSYATSLIPRISHSTGRLHRLRGHHDSGEHRARGRGA